jgi:hypothetical protein
MGKRSTLWALRQAQQRPKAPALSGNARFLAARIARIPVLHRPFRGTTRK